MKNYINNLRLMLIIISTVFTGRICTMARTRTRSVAIEQTNQRHKKLMHSFILFNSLDEYCQKRMKASEQEGGRSRVLVDKFVVVAPKPGENFMPTCKEAEQFVREIGAVQFTYSAKDLLDGSTYEARERGKKKIFDIYYKAREIEEKEQKPVVIVLTDMDELMKYEVNNDDNEKTPVQSGLHELLGKLEQRNSKVITIFTTEKSPETMKWISSSLTDPANWQLPGQELKDTILKIQTYRELQRKKNEDERLRKEEEIRKAKEVEEQKRRKLEEEEQQRKEILMQQKLAWEKEQDSCPLYKEKLSQVNESLEQNKKQLKLEIQKSQNFKEENQGLNYKIKDLQYQVERAQASQYCLKDEIKKLSSQYGIRAGIAVGSAVTGLALIAFHLYEPTLRKLWKKRFGTIRKKSGNQNKKLELEPKPKAKEHQSTFSI